MPNRVSVVMAVHNGEKYLRQAVESILAQTFMDFEFIIVNDGSNDSTDSILGEFASRDKRIIIVQNGKNIGLTRSLNRGLELAHGQLIARMDVDDISFPQRLEAQVDFMESHPEIGILGTAACVIDADGKKGQEIRFPGEHILLRQPS